MMVVYRGLFFGHLVYLFRFYIHCKWVTWQKPLKCQIMTSHFTGSANVRHYNKSVKEQLTKMSLPGLQITRRDRISSVADSRRLCITVCENCTHQSKYRSANNLGTRIFWCPHLFSLLIVHSTYNWINIIATWFYMLSSITPLRRIICNYITPANSVLWFWHNSAKILQRIIV